MKTRSRLLTVIVVLILTVVVLSNAGAHAVSHPEEPRSLGRGHVIAVLPEPGSEAGAAEWPVLDFTTPSEDTVVVSIEPTVSTATPGDGFTVSVMISNVVNLGAFQFALSFDPTVVHVQDVTLGSFLGSTGRTANPLGPTIDNELGLMSFGAYSMSYPPKPGPDGRGVLAEITLTGKGVGQTLLDLRDVQVLGPTGDAKPATAADGLATVKGEQLYLPLVLRH